MRKGAQDFSEQDFLRIFDESSLKQKDFSQRGKRFFGSEMLLLKFLLSPNRKKSNICSPLPPFQC